MRHSTHGSFFLLGLLSLSSAIAQEPPPANIVPISDEITIIYNPRFESQCKQSKYEKAFGASYGTRVEIESATKITESTSGVFKLTMRIDFPENFVEMAFALNESRSGFKSSEPEFATDFPMSKGDYDKFKKNITSMAKKAAGLGVIGRPLKQGVPLPVDICETLANGKTIAKSGGESLLGLATIKGRESVVVGSDISSTCSIAGHVLRLEGKGWTAYDRQSGLQVANSVRAVIEADDGSGVSSEDSDCSITETQ